jgi:hypothetical protein
MTAMAAFSRGIIFKKFNNFSALRAVRLKDGFGFPVSAVLSGTFHSDPSIILIFKRLSPEFDIYQFV